MLALIRSSFPRRAEFLWLMGLAFFLPLFEAPKNICWIAYVLTWTYNRREAGSWGGPWDRWDTLIALWIASGYVVATFSGVHQDEWREANDLLRYGSILLLVKRSRFGEIELLSILATVIGATLLTLAWGYWRVFVSGSGHEVGLHSVGHVNHSAIYMTIVFGTALSLTIFYWRRMGLATKTAMSLAVLALVVSVFITGSRAAAGAAVLFLLALGGTALARRHHLARNGVFAALIGVAVVFAVNPRVINKTISQSDEGLVLSYRDKIWANGLVEWRAFPLFGVGMGNFGKVRLGELERWNAAQSWSIRASPQGMWPHAHSLYVNTLAERGLFGFGVLLIVILAWGGALIRAVPKVDDPPIAWTIFGAALAGWLTTVAVGVVNTTLHHENAILSVLLFGLCLGSPPHEPQRSPISSDDANIKLS